MVPVQRRCKLDKYTISEVKISRAMWSRLLLNPFSENDLHKIDTHGVKACDFVYIVTHIYIYICLHFNTYVKLSVWVVECTS